MFPTFQNTTLYTSFRCQIQDWFILCLISMKLAAHICPNRSCFIHLTRGKLAQQHSKFINKFFYQIWYQSSGSVMGRACSFCPGDWSSILTQCTILGYFFLQHFAILTMIFTISKHNLWPKIIKISLNGITNAIEVEFHTFVPKTHFQSIYPTVKRLTDNYKYAANDIKLPDVNKELN